MLMSIVRLSWISDLRRRALRAHRPAHEGHLLTCARCARNLNCQFMIDEGGTGQARRLPLTAALPWPASYWSPAQGSDDENNALPALWASVIDRPGRRGQEQIHVLLIEDDLAIADMYQVQ